MGNVAATFRSACARLKAASTAIRLSSYFTDTTPAVRARVCKHVLGAVLRPLSIKNEGTSHDVVENKGRNFLSHDVYDK